MGKIQELDTVLADQIAAGEVIERPASVVKELVENAIDAHSTRIDIMVEEAGLQEIRIIDNGDGIASDELAIAFRRHATSKIQTRRDLFRVQTMGFRGEALPSIASIADVELVSAQANQAGAMIHLRGGEVLATQAASARPGTDITVRDLFYNTPARLKYLKSPRTELSKITDLVNRLALAEPGIAFSLHHDGKEVFRTVGNGNLQQVLATIYGTKAGQKMLPLAASDPDFKITGLVSLPELTRAGRNYVTLTINQRYIRSFPLTKALIAGYGSKLMVGRYPIAVLNIELDPILVDVNVHPAKREVRLSKEEQLTALITTAVAEVIGQQNLIPDVGSQTQELVAATAPALSEVAEPTAEVTIKRPVVVPHEPVIINTKTDLASPAMQRFDQRYQAPIEEQPAPIPPSQPLQTENVALDLTTATKTGFPQLTYLAQLHGTYLLAQAADGLYIVDQHAAQERINYERYRVEIGQVSRDQQNLLQPLIFDYPLTQALQIQDHISLLAELGLELTPFGQSSFMLSSHPTWFVPGQEADTAREMIDWVLQDPKLTVANFREKTAIMMSCKRAIKANHHLTTAEAQALLAKLPTCENPFNCPHGRPVTVHLTPTDLEKLFKRIQDQHQAYADDFDTHDEE
ncbi:DNA mismatch repair endonuclease MutL [Limosilactobacillus equigenerosi]|uniref:DNA mismatch repair protein MutL n=1 Tax=Limosilactobacillus equigenerosi DSM 18793 = JCM 14505 TaxID=1423742 RepID=A0A0R1UTD8_9LACO|nr:DNA mismatch repair endonuclease MutL [Limosilactobacillus equigenerosi]KRL96415.1 DNA mismatch repair protein mutL [Limosilactobacillus equigenerosi DSM 18793 = JCM 14505]